MLSLNKKYIKGVTLLETLIYVAIFAVVAGGLIGILSGTIDVVSKEDAINEVDENLRQAISTIGNRIRNTDIIQSATGTTLVLRMATTSPGGFSTTTFSVSNEMLYLTEGDNDPVAVISDKVKVDSLEFTKISMPGAKGGVRINMVLSYNSDKASLSFSKSILSTINRAVAITFNEDVLPGVDNSYNIGSSGNFRWRDGYFSGGLSVDGGVTSSQFCLSDGCQTSWAGLGLWTANGDDIYYNTGNVGIGTTTPDFLLHLERATSNPAIVWKRGDGATGYVSSTDSNVNFGSVSNHMVRFLIEGISKMVIDTDGEVGIGTSDPGRSLDVVGRMRIRYGDGESGGIWLANSTGSELSFIGMPSTLDYVGFWNSGWNLIVDNSGNVGIGDTTPSEKLDVAGNIGLTGTVIPDNACGITSGILKFFDAGNLGLAGNLLGGGEGGDVMVCSGKVISIGAQCGTADGSNRASFELRKNSVAQVCDIDDVNTADTGYSTTGCNISFSANDIIGCYLKSTTGFPQDCSCSLFVRFD